MNYKNLFSAIFFFTYDYLNQPCNFVCFQDFPLGGWSLERSVDGEPPVIYKFTPKYVLKTGSFVTVSPLVFESQCNTTKFHLLNCIFSSFDDFNSLLLIPYWDPSDFCS